MVEGSPRSSPDRTISGTYRLQLHAGFGFSDASAVVPYLADLGISHLYLSPVLQAAPDSTHGYDVVDHSRISADLGGEAGLLELAERAHSRGLGLVADIVPNHMALPTPAHLNRPLWQMLHMGRGAPTAHWFDVDWELCQGRLGLPVLGASLDEVLAGGELSLDEFEGEPVVRYFEQLFPVAPGTGDGRLVDVLARQHYLLASWQDKSEVLGYRRFFDVDTLVAVRVELPDVFDATHALLVDLHRRGVVDGFRIDHPDGLADPEDYLSRLAAATDGAWVVVEKILEGDEQLPRTWAAAGTTGYDAVRALHGALVADTGRQLSEFWRHTGGDPELASTELEAKQLVLRELFQPELRRLTRRAGEAARDRGADVSTDDLEAALGALLVHVEVYRAYVRLGRPADDDAVRRIDAMVVAARTDRPDLSVALELLRTLLLDSSSHSAAGRDLLVRFQQVCGPVMAKGVEDTTFYRFNRLMALNEVGGDPGVLDHPDAEGVHRWAEHQIAEHPTGMTTLTTHDTKRSEDVRARLLVAAEDIEGWGHVWERLSEAAAAAGVDLPTAYLVLQNLVGAWPVSAERLGAYLEKAVREAKLHTSWNEPDSEYERRVLSLGSACLQAPVASEIERWLADLAAAERAALLGTKLLQLTLPGIPDVYQGCELVERSLVDPDNRRPVDFAERVERLRRLDAGGACLDLDDEKLWLTSRVLRLRRQSAHLFGPESTYRALASPPPHLLGFVRAERLTVVTTRAPLAQQRTGWAAARISLPDGSWTDLLASRPPVTGGEVAVADLLTELPVALLLRESE
ncbi:MAG: malto-oligosyltrehalose synthase [Nocardioidaceae bacterium]